MIFNNNMTGLFSRNRQNKADRPVIRPEMTPIDWLLEAVAILGLMVYFGFVIYQYPKLPETVPSHFDGAGLPDEFAPRSTFWILPGVAVLVYALFAFIVLVPNQLNYSVKITPANALKQYTMAIRLIRVLKVVLIWMFFYINYRTVLVATGQSTGLGLWYLPVALGAIFLAIIVYFILAYRNR